jgi:hypothetical protein
MDRPDEPRTTDIFEQLPGYPKPPPAPLPDLGDLRLFTAFNVTDTPLAQRIAHGGMAASGFTSFVKKLKYDELECMLRSINLRLPGVFAPAYSTTSALLDDPRPLTPFQRAAALIFGAYSLYHSVICAELEPDRLRGKSLEMGQYPNLFSTSMILEGRKLALFKSVFEPQISVLVGGRIYLIQMENLETETWVEGLATALERLARHALPLPLEAPSLGLVTAASSFTQERIFNLMAHSPTNAPNLRALRRSFLTLCLDLDSAPETAGESARMAHSTNFTNRWFHSSLQIVVFGNARACLLTSYTAYLDGNVLTRGAAEIQKRAAVYPFAEEAAADDTIFPVQELTWDLDPSTLPVQLYQRAQAEIDNLLDDQTATFELTGMGSAYFDLTHLLPAPAFVLAVQAAASSLSGRTAEINLFSGQSTYCCMDVIQARVSTPAVKQFARAVNLAVDPDDNPDSDPGQARALLQSALESHATVLEAASQHIPTDILMLLFERTRRGGQQFRARTCLAAMQACLVVLRQANRRLMRDVIVSFPAVHPEVLLVGRPGVRSPYVKSFGLHCQIQPDKTVLTLMPGLGWRITNDEVAGQIVKNLKSIAQIATRTG